MANDDIDQLFRDAAEHYKPEQHASDWSLLAEKLERPASGNRWWLWFLLVSAFLAEGIYLHGTKQALPGAFFVKVSPRSGERDLSPIHRKAATPEGIRDPAITQKPARIISITPENPKGPSTQPAVQKKGENDPVSATNSNPDYSQGSRVRQPLHVDSGQTGAQGTPFTADLSVSQATLPELYRSHARAALARISDAIPASPGSAREGRSETPVKWQAGILLGPDLTLVNTSLWSNPGLDAGLSLRYHISGKWQLQASILYSSKIYKALPSEYHPKKPDTNYPGLQQISANCKVLDLALDLRYNLRRTKTGIWFAQTGLSSYWMSQEAYTFNYKTAGYPSSSSWSISNQDRHPLSILNLSAGYECATSKKVTWQVSPYLKLPLSGIGYGRVHLVSTGVLFSLNFGL
jgi:hypothetical protein